ncbi:MAG: hypothetical protein R3B06_08900 [Kofleriaceae bacterium]
MNLDPVTGRGVCPDCGDAAAVVPSPTPLPPTPSAPLPTLAERHQRLVRRARTTTGQPSGGPFRGAAGPSVDDRVELTMTEDAQLDAKVSITARSLEAHSPRGRVLVARDGIVRVETRTVASEWSLLVTTARVVEAARGVPAEVAGREVELARGAPEEIAALGGQVAGELGLVCYLHGPVQPTLPRRWTVAAGAAGEVVVSPPGRGLLLRLLGVAAPADHLRFGPDGIGSRRVALARVDGFRLILVDDRRAAIGMMQDGGVRPAFWRWPGDTSSSPRFFPLAEARAACARLNFEFDQLRARTAAAAARGADR